MVRPKWIYWFLLLIAGVTILSGLLQMVAPGVVLRLIGAPVTPASGHFFGLVGMFMALFGGALWQALRAGGNRVVLFWSGLQKAGAVLGVAIGVYREIFSGLALGVAGFDLLSAVLIFYYWFHQND